MISDLPFVPDRETLESLGATLTAILRDTYMGDRSGPRGPVDLPPIPARGEGAGALPRLWRLLKEGSAPLGSPAMSGHMDTAPHPFAALTQALVAALNNNLLFRELSPLASTVEEALIADFIQRLGIGPAFTGTWASGGSLANLTALFCAVGGFERLGGRDRARVLLPESGHASLRKAGAVLGLSPDQVIDVPCDDAGRMDPTRLTSALSALPAGAAPVVVSVLGSTIHGSLDDVATIGEICGAWDAWHHVDAIYGAAVMFSQHHAHRLAGLETANSIVLGPQKWMFVPRVSAVVLVRGHDLLERRLGQALPYSLSPEIHRGTWGLQGSRPADALVLWTLLQALGSETIGAYVDHGIAMARRFHDRLQGSGAAFPTHVPDLNIQVFSTEADAALVQQILTEAGGFLASLSQWRARPYLRAVLLSPRLTDAHLTGFVADIKRAVEAASVSPRHGLSPG